MTSNAPVWIFCQQFYPELISTGQTVTELAEGFDALGQTVRVLCAQPSLFADNPKWPRKMTHKTHITIERLPSTQFRKIHLIGKIINHLTFATSVMVFLLTQKVEGRVFVYTNPPALPIVFAFCRWFRGPEYTLVVYDLYPQTAVQLGVLSPHNPITQIWVHLSRFSIRKATQVIVLGRCMANAVRPLLPQKNSQSLHVIPHWASDDHFLPLEDPNPLRERWHLRGKFVVTYAGNMGRFHDIETIVSAAFQLQQRTDVVFLFTGDGYKKKWLLSEIQRLNLTNCIVKNYVPREELGWLLRLGDLALVTLLDAQLGLSVPSKTYPMMVAKVPIVAIMPSGCEIAQMFNENECGWVIPPGNVADVVRKIEELRQHPEAGRTIAEKAFEVVSKDYRLIPIAKRYLAIGLRPPSPGRRERVWG